MYKIEWSKDNKNLPILNDFAQDNIIPPRPVFFEELDLLGFNKYFKYPSSENPLLWAIGRDYYYDSVKVARAVGGDINNAPVLEIYHDGVEFEPIDIDILIKLNKSKIEVLKNEAIEFTKKVYKEYANKVDFFIVAFSGGKDSQVLLDLVTIALEPERYKVIFTDTTMELPHTYETVEKTEKHYKNIYKNFKITSVRNPIDAADSWNTFGPPSRILRWCCSVYKTSPVHNYLKSLNNGKHPKTILFDGVRRDESNNRANHLRIADGVKHNGVLNTRPIIEWNDFEVYLYLFYSGVKLNNEYRIGLNRVGCSICPFASQWSDYIIAKQYPNIAEKFISSIDTYMQNSNVHNKKEYLENGNWKKRAGGNSIETMNNIEIYDQENNLEIFMDNSNENFFEWLKVLGNYKTDTQKNNVHINIDDHNILNIKYDKHSNKEKITTSSSNIIDLSHLKKIAYKANYCVHCGSCEAECPTGALNVFPKVNIDTTLCIHCSKCLDFHNKGCVMADSAHKTVVGEGKGNNDIKGFNDYGDFGLRQEWLTNFFNNGFNWVVENELGTKQKISIKKWFRDAELVDSKVKMTTPFFMLLQKNSLSDNNKYQLILINLYHNSSLLKWYIDNIPVNNSLNTNELAILAKEYTGLAETTIKHSINSLVNLFDTTPLGEELKIGFITKEKNIRSLEKIGTDNVSNEAILYSLYKLKETKSRDNFRVSEFYDEGFEGGPYKIFGINKDVLTQKLRFISEETKLIDVDLNQGLDNVFLKDLSAMDVLKEVLK